MPKLLNNTDQTFRVLGYAKVNGRLVVVDKLTVPPGFSDLSDSEYQEFKKTNQRALDLGWVVDNNKPTEEKIIVPMVEDPPKKKRKKKSALKDFD